MTCIIGEKRIGPSYPIRSNKEIAVVIMLSDNVQYWLQGPIEVLLKTGKKIVLNKGVYTDKELNSLIGLELKSQMLDSCNDVLRTNKLEKSRRWLSAWKNLIAITSKMVDPATPYLHIMLLALDTLRVLNQ